MKASGSFHGRSDKSIRQSRTKDGKSDESFHASFHESFHENLHGFESFHESTSKVFYVLVPWEQAAASTNGRKLTGFHESFESSFQERL